MDDKWRILTRVRDVRARLALNELMQERKLRARAQATLQQVLDRKAQLEHQSEQASRVAAAVVSETGFNAAQVQDILDYAAGARVQARQTTIPMRRAQLQCDRAQEAVDKAGANYRQEAARQETVNSHWQKLVRASQRLRMERDDANVVEERAGFAVARARRDECDGAGIDEEGGQP